MIRWTIIIFVLLLVSGCMRRSLSEEVEWTNAKCPILICDGKARIDSLDFAVEGRFQSIYVCIVVNSMFIDIKGKDVMEKVDLLLKKEVLDEVPVVKRLPLDTFLSLRDGKGNVCEMPFRW